MVSIIIVNYKVKKELFSCIKSIVNSNPKTGYEIIVVDNDEVKTIKKDLSKLFPFVKYIPSEKNIGYGSGINLGSKNAKGDFLFFLNPDTLVKKSAIDQLVNFLQQNKKVGVVAPLLLDNNENPYPLQGTLELTPKRAIFSHSVINRFLPKNHISKEFWQVGWDKSRNHNVDVVPGTAFMISKKLFEKIGGFDEKFFLYFEEFDLCKKVKEMGYELTIMMKARIIHFWEVSTKQRNDINEIFSESRFYYFKKNYGIISALFTSFVLGLGKYSIAVFLILVSFLFISINNLNNSMAFIGDQGWFYLSARDLVLSGKVPLVGITSSHTWIHQGPIWTYMLGLVMFLFGFNPINGGYLSVLLSLATVYLVFYVGRKMFSSTVGVIASLFYATSPLIFSATKMPYHTSPVPFFSLLLIYFIYKWTRGKAHYFPGVVFLLALLYNFELATFVLAIPVIGILAYGVIKKQEFVKKIFILKYLMLSLLAFLAPMLPFLIYDTNYGFPQTFKFVAWLGYRLLVFFRIIGSSSGRIFSADIVSFILNNLSKLIFAYNSLFSILLLTASIIFLLVYIYKKRVLGNLFSAHLILLIFILIPLAGLFVNKTVSDAYIPIFFPSIILAVAVFLGRCLSLRFFKLITILLILLISLFNLNYINNNYLNGTDLKQRTEAVDKIIKMSEGKDFKIKGKGPGSNFESFTMNYEYLLWWKGHAPVKKNTDIIFTIEENKKGISILRQND
ncbi:glycosyltransferase [Patescibacteria group bacterium]|nr:glycosyltransferase [Patescibacteria group bacterium]